VPGQLPGQSDAPTTALPTLAAGMPDVTTIAVSGAVGFLAATGTDLIKDAVRYRREREQRQDEREDSAARDRAQAQRELRKAARPIVAELLYSRGILESALERGAYWDPDERGLPAQAWEQKADAVAAHAGSTDAWRLAADAYSRLDGVNWDARADKAYVQGERERIGRIEYRDESELEGMAEDVEGSVSREAASVALEATDRAVEALNGLIGDS
jgi:hypothetical protein